MIKQLIRERESLGLTWQQVSLLQLHWSIDGEDFREWMLLNTNAEEASIYAMQRNLRDALKKIEADEDEG